MCVCVSAGELHVCRCKQVIEHDVFKAPALCAAQPSHPSQGRRDLQANLLRIQKRSKRREKYNIVKMKSEPSIPLFHLFPPSAKQKTWRWIREWRKKDKKGDQQQDETEEAREGNEKKEGESTDAGGLYSPVVIACSQSHSLSNGPCLICWFWGPSLFSVRFWEQDTERASTSSQSSRGHVLINLDSCLLPRGSK